MSGPQFCDRCRCRPTMFGSLEGDDRWPLEYCGECRSDLCQRCLKSDHEPIADLSDLCLRCGVFIEQVDETDPCCYAMGEQYRCHEFSFKAHHRHQKRDLEKLKAWTDAALP